MNQQRTIEIPKNVVKIAIESTKRPTERSAYERRWTFDKRKSGLVGLYWASLNIGRGYRGRLVFIYRNGFRRVVARKISYRY